MMPFSLKKLYNFNTLAGVMLGQSYQSMKVVSIMDSKQAIQHADILTIYNNVKTVISNLPSSVDDLTYILFENTDKEKVLLALEYIEISSVVEVETIDIVMKVYDVTTEDLSIIRKAVSELGYSNIGLSVTGKSST